MSVYPASLCGSAAHSAGWQRRQQQQQQQQQQIKLYANSAKLLVVHVGPLSFFTSFSCKPAELATQTSHGNRLQVAKAKTNSPVMVLTRQTLKKSGLFMCVFFCNRFAFNCLMKLVERAAELGVKAYYRH